MPFTFSHLAAVMPFSRPLKRSGLLSAAAIGAMVPDFHLFVPWHMARWDTHALIALFTWCLPVGLLTYWVFQYLLKRPMIEMLGDGPYARWQSDRAPRSIGSWKQWLLACVGILLGAITHDFWDAFTHEGARGNRFLAMLDEPLFDGHLHHIIATRIAQDASSVLGLLLVLGLLAYGLRRGREPAVPRLFPHAERVIWVLGYFTATFGLTLLFYVRLRIGDPHPHWVPGIINDMAVASLRGLATALLIFSMVLQLRISRQAPTSV
jgi:Domain of unknown function (DUF4184)